MIECKELANKVIGVFAIYEGGQYGPEVHIELPTALHSVPASKTKSPSKRSTLHGMAINCTS